MLKFAISSVALVTAMAVMPTASAQNASSAQFEVSGGVGVVYDADISIFAGTGRLGIFSNNTNGFQLGAEAEATIGLSEDELFGVDVELSNSLGGFAVGRMGSDTGSFHVRLGYMANSFDFQTTEADLNGFALGLGGTYFFNPQVGIRGDITSTFVDEVEYNDGSSVDVDDSLAAANVSLVYRF